MVTSNPQNMSAPVYDITASMRPASAPTGLDRTAAVLNKFPAKVAFTLIGAGLLAIVIGAAGVRSATVPSGSGQVVAVVAQLPYLMSGGIGGLALVIVGVALLIVQSHRADTAQLQLSLAALLAAQLAAAPVHTPTPDDVAGLVVAGSSSYHVPTCRLVDGRDDQTYLLPAEARMRGLAPCRVCGSASV